MHIRPSSATLALSTTLACTINLPSETQSTTESTAPDPSSGETGTSGTTDGTAAPTEPTGAETAAPTDPTTETGGDPVWCHGFDPKAPFALTFNNEDGMKIVDGAPLPVVCGGQGSLMLPIYPQFGGFVPNGDTAVFDVVLDVEGFNLGPTGHFFESIGNSHTIDCSYEDPYYSYSFDFIPIFPPDAIPDLTALDGKPGVLNVTLHTPDGDIPFAADVVLKSTIDCCGYSCYYETDTDTGSDTGTDTGTDTGASTG